MERSKRHDVRVNSFLANPGRLVVDRNGDHGLVDVVACGTMNFFGENGRLVSQPDGVFFTKYGGLYLVEYKCDGCRCDALRQLRNSKDSLAVRFFEGFGLGPSRFLYVCNDLRVEEVYL